MKKKRIKCRVFLITLVLMLGLTVPASADGSRTDKPPDPPEKPTQSEEATKNEPSSVVTTPQTMKTAVKQTTALISKRISNVIAPVPASGKFQNPIIGFYTDDDGIGLSAGDGEQNFGIWGNIAITGSDDEHSVTESDFNLSSYIIGTDYKFTPEIVTGISLTYENLDGTTHYNSGEMNSDGFTLSPYFAVLVTENFGFDLSAGYTWLNIDQERNKDGRIEKGRGTMKSSLDSERMFVSVNANGYHNIGQFNLSGNIGYLYAEEKQDSFTERDDNASKDVSSNKVRFGQISIGGEVSYVFESVEPYFNAAFEYDTTYDKDISTFGEDISEIEHDDSGFTVGGGFRFLLFNMLQGDIGVSKVFAREDYDEYSVMGNLRFEF